MAKKPGAAAPAGETRVFALSRPIVDGGVQVTSLTCIEPKLQHMITAEREPTGGGLAANLISQLSGVSQDAVLKVKLGDLRQIERWIKELRASGTARFEEDPQGGAVFHLALPIETNGPPITSIRLREPDIEASIAVERFKRHSEQTAAMIASLSDLTIPLVSRLALRDVAVIEAYLAPFVASTPSMEAAGAT